MTPRLIMRLAATATIAAISFGAATAAKAQSAFSPAITINDRIVTYFEIEQRALLLAIMNTPGDARSLAREQLIEDRLKQQAASIAGITPTEDGIQRGFEDFAARANMKSEDMIKALASEGIDQETIRAFIVSGLAWRGVVQNRFGASIQVTEEEIDRAVASNSGAGGVRVLLSEIVIPVTPQNRAAANSLATQLSEIVNFSDFEAAARSYSGAPTKVDGGKIDWMSITNLPPNLRPMITALGPGEVTDPVQLPNAVALFQMRRIEETGRRQPSYAAIDYAMFYIAGGRTPEALAQATKIINRIDRCDDLYGVARDLPPEVLVREALPPGEIPRDIALELAKMDDNETSTNLTTAQAADGSQSLILLMLCGRTAKLDEELSREDILQALRNQRLESFADSYLSQLRAEARIIEK